MDFAIEYLKRMRALLSSFFVPKYAIKAAGGRKQLVAWYNKMYQFSIKFVILLNK